jgi:hypothetical protein
MNRQQFADEMFRLTVEPDTKLERFTSATPEEQAAMLERARGRCLQAAEKFLTAVEQRDIKQIEMSVCNTENKVSRKAFAAITGVQLGKTSKEAYSAVRKWIGPAVYDAHKQGLADQRANEEKEREAKRQADEKKAKLGEKVRFAPALKGQGGVAPVMTREEMIQWLVAEDYQPEEAKRGFRKTLRMVKGETYVTLETRIECEYARELLANVAAKA